MRYLYFLFLILFFSFSTFAQNSNSKRNYTTKKLSEFSNDNNAKLEPKIDGVFSDEIWQKVKWENSFTQHEPNDGKRATQKTSFAIVYDDEFVYVGIKAYDTKPDSIVNRMTRRDNIDGDHVAVQFDSYFDNRTAFTFLLSSSGVKGDFIMSNDGESEDATWNPIWWGETNMDSDGWSAEMKIPFTQLRFSKADNKKWGLQVARVLFRKEELSLWQPISKEASGWVSNIGTIDGLNIVPQKQFDITPYFTSAFETYEAEAGDPYYDGRDLKLNAGVDGKIGLTNNFTLDFTVNPDFGQVEADPSQVNLSAYESFFSEQRPFFVEGRSILSYPLMFGDGDLASQNLFYSRRIGSNPHHYPDIEDNEFMKMPDKTTILGAAKITGKTPDGWSVGVMESLTAKETAKIMNEGTERTETVEPLTNYFVARVQKDINKGNSLIGAVVTGVNRFIEDEHLDFLHKDAFSGGIDFTQYFKDKTYFLKVNTYWSHVRGSKWAIEETQLSSARYFQRPDADYLNFDASKTQLTGSGGNIQVGKQGGKLKYLLSASMKSPALELNDIGYLQEVDDIMEVFWVGYRIYEPFSIFRSVSMNFNQWAGWDFGGTNTYNGGNINMHTQFKNYWSFSFGTNINGESISNGSLRGGESLRLPGSKNLWLYMGTNDQKKFRFSANASFNKSFEDTYRSYAGYYLSLSYRPTSTLRISLSPNFTNSMRELQYIDEIEFNNENRYIFAKLEQKMVGMSIRINYNINPELSIQYWGQPFIAAGGYSEFKYITNPHADKYSDRFHTYANNEISYVSENNEFAVNETGNGETDYYISNPEFNFKEFKSNMVLKWEYRPGSAIYLVWSQHKADFVEDGAFNIQEDMNSLFGVKAKNVFLVKFSYRIGL